MRLAAWHRKPGGCPSLCSVRSFISAEEISIRNAKEFLARQTHSMRKRHMALRAARQQWHQDLQKAWEAAQDPDSSQLLEDVHKNLEEVSPRALPALRPGVSRPWGCAGIGSWLWWQPRAAAGLQASWEAARGARGPRSVAPGVDPGLLRCSAASPR